MWVGKIDATRFREREFQKHRRLLSVLPRGCAIPFSMDFLFSGSPREVDEESFQCSFTSIAPRDCTIHLDFGKRLHVSLLQAKANCLIYVQTHRATSSSEDAGAAVHCLVMRETTSADDQSVGRQMTSTLRLYPVCSADVSLGLQIVQGLLVLPQTLSAILSHSQL